MRRRLLLVVCILLGGRLIACQSSAEPSPPSRAYWDNSPRVCGENQVREYYCDELLPLGASLAGERPFEHCPGSIESHSGDLDPVPPVAAFDLDYTRYIRKRSPPGHSCCYSWCSPLKVVDPVPPSASCNRHRALHELYCIGAPEGGTSRPAPAPLGGCPRAIVPPASRAFSVPSAANLDANATFARRSAGFDECCYGWCSDAPQDAVLAL